MAKQPEKASKLKVKKRWFPIFSPRFLGQKEIGESYLNEVQEAVGRILRVNLRDLTGSVKDQNIYISLKIRDAEGSNLQTDLIGYAYMPFYVKKLARKSTSVLDDSFILKTKDGKTARLKPLVVTVFKVNNSAKTAIRKKMKELLKEEADKMGFDSLINDVLKYRLQMDLKKKLSKICPVREVVLRAVKLERGEKSAEADEKADSREEQTKRPEEDKESIEIIEETGKAAEIKESEADEAVLEEEGEEEEK